MKINTIYQFSLWGEIDSFSFCMQLIKSVDYDLKCKIWDRIVGRVFGRSIPGIDMIEAHWAVQS